MARPARSPLTRLLNAFLDASGPDHAPGPSGASGPLCHAGIAVKANLCARGWPATAASKALLNYVAPYSATAVERVQSAGAHIAGVTNMDEFGMGSATAFSAHGPTYSPFSALFAALQRTPAPVLPDVLDRARHCTSWLTPGGSSGGSAVAVATGACLAALGSDTGGSVRQPASFCGVVGFKPSYGRVPRTGLIAYASSLDTVGVLARSVGAAARVYDVVAGHDPRDDTSVRVPHRGRGRGAEEGEGKEGEGGGGGLAHTLAQGGAYGITRSRGVSSSSCPSLWSLEGLRVGLPVEYHVAELGRWSVEAWHAGADLLRGAGATVVPVSLPATAASLPAYYVLAPAEAASNLSRYDGVRYGHRSPPLTDTGTAQGDGEGSTSGGGGHASSAARWLHEEFTRTRTSSLGAEVARRVVTGNYVLSAAARGAFYDSAVAVRQEVARDFHAVFRSRDGSDDGSGGGAPPHPLLLLSSLHCGAGVRATGCAHPSQGVDVLLAPTAPALPWASADTGAADPLSVYLGDVMTIPASLAGLPAVSLPVAAVPYPPHLLQAAERDVRALGLLGHGQGAASLLGGLTLPVGLQVIGRYLDEDTVLRVASVLEKAAGFSLPAHVSSPQLQAAGGP